MAWYNFSKLLRFGIDSRRGTINGQPAILEIDSFSLSKNQETYYKKDAKFVAIQGKNYVANNVIGASAKRISNALFSDVDSSTESRLLQKINSPNDDQTKEEFLKEFTIHILSSGWTAVYKKYKSFGDFNSLQLINLNPDDTEIHKKTVVTIIDKKPVEIDKDHVMFFYDTLSHCGIGVSRLIPLRSQINNITLAQIAKGIQITNSGTTIVSPKAAANSNVMDQGLDAPVPTLMSNTKTQKQEMEDRLNYRGMKNRIIVSNKGLDAVNLSEKLNNVKFFDIVEQDILAVYDAYGYPVELTPYGKNAKFENRPAAETQLIEDEILPLANNFVNSLNQEFSEYGKIKVSFDHLLSVAQTKLQVHTVNKTIIENYSKLFNDGVITIKEYQELLTQNNVI